MSAISTNLRRVTLVLSAILVSKYVLLIEDNQVSISYPIDLSVVENLPTKSTKIPEIKINQPPLLEPPGANVLSPTVKLNEPKSKSHPRFSKKWFMTQAQKMNSVDENPLETDRELHTVANLMDPNQVQFLFQTVINSQAGQNQRMMALYLLVQKSDTPIEIFKKIALLRIPENAGEIDFERNMIISFALTSLDQIQKRINSKSTAISTLESLSKLTNCILIKDAAWKMANAVKNGKEFSVDL